MLKDSVLVHRLLLRDPDESDLIRAYRRLEPPWRGVALFHAETLYAKAVEDKGEGAMPPINEADG